MTTRSHGHYHTFSSFPPSSAAVLAFPRKGDLLCFDGREWRVARRDGVAFEVRDPEIIIEHSATAEG